MIRRVEKSDEEWRKELPADTYRIARHGGTEPPFSGQYWNSKGVGVYRCACCGTDLFDSETKYDSGSGWPSFSAPVDRQNVATAKDESHGLSRTEVLCAACDAHLGHVFDDGPPPTGARYCINSGALRFDARGKEPGPAK